MLRRDEAEALLGHGLAAFALAASTLKGVPFSEVEQRRFAHEYAADPLTGTKLYPHVSATLNLLAQRGWRLVVCANKAEAPATTILAGLGILKYFNVICCGDTVKHPKPHPGHLSDTLQRGGLHRLPAVMIGDNAVDIAAASSFGITSVFAAWGYGQTDAAYSPSAVAASFDEIPAILQQLIPSCFSSQS